MPGPVTSGDTSRVFDLAACLAKPVGRGLLPESHAEACIWATTMRAWRAGTLAHDPVAVGEAACTVLRCHV